MDGVRVGEEHSIDLMNISGGEKDTTLVLVHITGGENCCNKSMATITTVS